MLNPARRQAQVQPCAKGFGLGLIEVWPVQRASRGSQVCFYLLVRTYLLTSGTTDGRQINIYEENRRRGLSGTKRTLFLFPREVVLQ